MKHNLRKYLINKELNLRFFSPSIKELSSFARAHIEHIVHEIGRQDEVSDLHDMGGSWNNFTIIPTNTYVLYACWRGGKMVSTTLNNIKVCERTTLVFAKTKKDTYLRNIGDMTYEKWDNIIPLFKCHCANRSITVDGLTFDDICF